MKTFIALFVAVLLTGYFFMAGGEDSKVPVTPEKEKVTFRIAIPPQKTLKIPYYIHQTFNNCAPAALSIALSYYDIKETQEALAAILRPNNNLTGKDDDKSTPPDELAAEAERRGLLAYHRAGGDIALLKELIAGGFPVVIRALLEPDKDYAHYRVIKGYDETTGEIIQDDSIQGQDLRYTNDGFLKIWKPFNYSYLVLAKPERKIALERILGSSKDKNMAWQNALEIARGELSKNPVDREAQFNLATTLYYLGDYEGAVREFEKVEARLSMHVMWYQLEPIESYFQLGNYAKVFSMTDKIFKDGNKAYAELYVLRGKSYAAEGDKVKAREEYNKALLYHRGLPAALEAIDRL